jgi:Antitoxin VbhA
MKAMLPEERARRVQYVENTLATLRIEGLEIDAETRAIFERYIDQEITLEELGAVIDELNNRDYGPVRLSGE